MDFEVRLHKHEFILNDTDDSIADYIKSNRKIINSISIKKISSDLFVSPNSIMRFSKKLEYAGFSDMKFSIARENKVIAEKSQVHLNNISKTISRTNELLDEEILENFAERIINSKSCVVLGMGDNLYFCEMFSKYIKAVKIKCNFYSHHHEMLYAVNECTHGDLIIIISVSGEKERLLNFAKIAKENNVDVVSLTHFSRNSLSDIAQYNMYFFAEVELINGHDVTDRTGIMYFIRAVARKLWKKRCV